MNDCAIRIEGLSRAEIDRHFDAIVSFAEVDKFVDTPVKHYSTGMRMRLAFAVPAHLDAETLLVDEVLAVGDAGFQKKCLGAMNTLSRSGRTVLLVSHNMAAIENLSSRTIWIEDGRIQEDGDSTEIVKAYQSSFPYNQETGFDLGSVKSRSGSGAIRYTGIEFLGPNGEPQKFIRSGDKYKCKALLSR